MKKVLIIEDEMNIRDTLSDILELLNYQIVQAENGERGIELADQEKPDIIICDINMPGKDGYEVLQALTGMDLLLFVPFIFLTANSTMEDLRKGMEMGADDYLTKPFTHESLVKTIQSCERKKLSQLDQLNTLQNKLNAEKLKMKDVDWLNSHEIRRRTSMLQGLLPIIRSGQLSLDEGINLLEETGNEMESTTLKLNTLLNGSQQENGPVKRFELDINNIWLVDDDPTQNMVNRFVLKHLNANWQIEEYSNPAIALNSLKEKIPDLIFLDINMPEMTGFQFLECIRKEYPGIEVIMLSSSVSPEDIRKSLSFSNVISYLTKPLKKDFLKNII